MAHCRREVIHAQWSILLDDEFVASCKHGIVIHCFDGVERRFYLRIFTYSADYPEKCVYNYFAPGTHSLGIMIFRVLLASIRDKGRCPCPHCLMPLKKVHNLGTTSDMKQRQTLARVDDNSRRNKIKEARTIIYDKIYAVDNEAVENLLKEQSLVATNVSCSIVSSTS